MLPFVVRRLLIALPVLFGVSLATFVFANLAPGDPVTAMIDPETAAALGPDWIQQQREVLGLNQPPYVRYVLWLKEVARGNLGYSVTDRQAIATKIGQRLGPTLLLMTTALVIGMALSIPIGLVAAVKQYSWIDYLSNVVGLATISVPGFFVGLAGLYLFGVRFGWLPTAGMVTPEAPASLGDGLRHLVLPATVLGLAEAAPLIRYTRASVLDVLHEDYVKTARAKGLREWRVLVRHAFPNALIPLITVVALQFPSLVGGAVVIEQVFAWPGMGTLAITAIFGRDYPAIMAINLLGGVAIVLSSLLADVLYAVVDPRVGYAR